MLLSKLTFIALIEYILSVYTFPGNQTYNLGVASTMLLYTIKEAMDAHLFPVHFLRPLHLAARSGMKQTVQELLSRGASVQVLDENGASS